MMPLRFVYWALVAGHGLPFSCQRQVGWSTHNHAYPEKFLLVKVKNVSLHVKVIYGMTFNQLFYFLTHHDLCGIL